jgi:transposase-like protein
VSLVVAGGLLNQLTKNVLATALEAELTEHLGHEHGQTSIAANMRNGTRSKTVLTEIGPAEIGVPRRQAAPLVTASWGSCPRGSGSRILLRGGSP